MQLKYYKMLFLAGLTISNTAQADCWFNCDSVNRNLASDFARTAEVLKKITNKTKYYKKNYVYFCGTNDKNEMYVASLQKDLYSEALIVNFNQYSPPKYGSTTWKATKVDIMPTLKVAKTLNFGVVGLKDSISPDKRCRIAFKGKQQSDSFIVVCNYAKNANLPISKFGMSLHDFTVPIDVCN